MLHVPLGVHPKSRPGAVIQANICKQISNCWECSFACSVHWSFALRVQNVGRNIAHYVLSMALCAYGLLRDLRLESWGFA